MLTSILHFQESNSFETTQGEDKLSDTSEEVTASDSGKGGSEDELPTQSHGKTRFMLVTIISELQISGGIKDNSKIIFLISQQKHIL